MKTCAVKSVYESIVQLRGIDPAAVTLGAADMAVIADYVNERVKEGYERTFWPEIMLAEQREYRAIWSDTTNYATGDEVYHVAADGGLYYYISLQDGNVGKDPDVETTWWSEVGDDFLRTISFQQDGETEIGDVDLGNCIFETDPRINRFAKLIEDVIYYGDGILVNSDEAPAQPWIWFRPPTPQFSLTAWASGTAYGIGDLCYYAGTGESYKALQVNSNRNPSSETEYWEPVEFPAFLKVYVKYGAHADHLLDPVERGKFEQRAEAELQALEEKMVDQRGVQRKVVFGR
jgi:hypothetical protein